MCGEAPDEKLKIHELGPHYTLSSFQASIPSWQANRTFLQCNTCCFYRIWWLVLSSIDFISYAFRGKWVYFALTNTLDYLILINHCSKSHWTLYFKVQKSSIQLLSLSHQNVTVNSTIEVVAIDRNGEASIVRNISATELQMILTESNGSLRLEGLRQNENFTIELQEGTENTTLSNPVILCECRCMTIAECVLQSGCQYLTNCTCSKG